MGAQRPYPEVLNSSLHVPTDVPAALCVLGLRASASPLVQREVHFSRPSGPVHCRTKSHPVCVVLAGRDRGGSPVLVDGTLELILKSGLHCQMKGWLSSPFHRTALHP